MSGTSPGRVRSSGFVMAYTGFLWLILPTGWPSIGWFVVLGISIDDTDTEPTVKVVALVLLAVPGVLLWWLWWRIAGISARPEPAGLRVRGAWRTRTVPWDRVLAVDATEFASYGRGFSFSHAAVTIALPDGRSTRVKVSQSWRNASTARRTIQSWLPTTHPAYRPPAEPVVRTTPAGQPEHLVTTVPMARSARTIALVAAGFGTLLLAFYCYRLFTATGLNVFTGVVGGVLVLLVLLIGLVVLRLDHAKVELTSARLINHGLFGADSYRVEEIEGFAVGTAPIGGTLRVVLIGRGSRQLAAGGGTRDDNEQALRALEQWLAVVQP